MLTAFCPGHRHLDNRNISENRLAALGVGLFDKNMALQTLYVEQGERSGAWQVRRSKRSPRRNLESTSYISRFGDDGVSMN